MLRPLVGRRRSGFDYEALARRIKERYQVETSAAEVARWTMEAVRRNMGEEARRNAKSRDEWIYDNDPLYREIVDIARTDFKIKPSEKFSTESFSGSFISPPRSFSPGTPMR